MCGITTKTKRHKAKACECHAHPYIPLFNAFIFVNRGAEVERWRACLDGFLSNILDLVQYQEASHSRFKTCPTQTYYRLYIRRSLK